MLIEGGIRIAAAPGRVYEVLVDPANWARLDPTLLEVVPMTTLSVGTTGTMRNRRGPAMVARATWTTTELVPGRRITQLLRGMGYELTETVALEPDADGTTMTVTDTLVPTGLVGRVMVALSRGIMERDLESRSRRLKAWLEA